MSREARLRAPSWIHVVVALTGAWSIVACVAIGCGGAEPAPPRHAPVTTVTQSGLEAALTGWCAEAGPIPGCVDGGAP